MMYFIGLCACALAILVIGYILIVWFLVSMQPLQSVLP